MASYRILIKASAAKELEEISKKDGARVIERIKSLSEDPRPFGAEKLTGANRYRVRQGNYRILYEIHDKEIVIMVVKIGHRREVYR